VTWPACVYLLVSAVARLPTVAHRFQLYGEGHVTAVGWGQGRVWAGGKCEGITCLPLSAADL